MHRILCCTAVILARDASQHQHQQRISRDIYNSTTVASILSWIMERSTEDPSKRVPIPMFPVPEEEPEKAKITARRAIFAALGLLVCVVVSSLITLRDQYYCQATANEESLCKKFRRDFSCRTTVATPLNLLLSLRLGYDNQLLFKIQCGWDAASSELRVAFVFTAILLILIGLTGLADNDLKRAEIYLYGGLFLSTLLFISAFFDVVLIKDSLEDNFSICDARGRQSLPREMQPQELECSYLRYYVTVVLTICSAGALVTSAYFMSRWKESLNNVHTSTQ